jgi:hypothetical protein
VFPTEQQHTFSFNASYLLSVPHVLSNQKHHVWKLWCIKHMNNTITFERVVLHVGVTLSIWQLNNLEKIRVDWEKSAIYIPSWIPLFRMWLCPHYTSPCIQHILKLVHKMTKTMHTPWLQRHNTIPNR